MIEAVFTEHRGVRRQLWTGNTQSHCKRIKAAHWLWNGLHVIPIIDNKKTIKHDISSVNNHPDASVVDHLHNLPSFFILLQKKNEEQSVREGVTNEMFLVGALCRGQRLPFWPLIRIFSFQHSLLCWSWLCLGKLFHISPFFSASTVEELMFLVSSPCWLRLSPHPRGAHNWRLMQGDSTEHVSLATAKDTPSRLGYKFNVSINSTDH